MSLTVAELRAVFSADTSQYDAGVAKIAQSGDHLQSVGRKMTLGITAPLAALGVTAVKTEGQYSSTMAQLAVATGAPQKQMKELGRLALKTGADTVFSANEAASAMLELAKGGMTTAQIKAGALKGTVALAATENMALADAATVVVNSLSQFDLKASKAARVADTLAAGSIASTASVTSLSQGLQQVGPAAKTAGLNLNDTVGVLSLFDSNALKGADAGTSLKTMLARLVPTTDKARSAMADHNLEFVKANGEFKSITQIAGLLQRQLGGLSEAERVAAVNAIFGSDAQRAANILVDEGAKGVAKMIAKTHEHGAAQKMANAAMQGTRGALERMSGSLETAALMAGKALAPAVVVVADKVAAAANAFAGWDSGMQTGVAVAGVLLAALGPLVWIIGMALHPAVVAATAVHGAFNAVLALGSRIALGTRIQLGLLAVQSAVTSAATGVYTAAQWLLNAALTANPIGLVIVALVALGAALVVAYKKSDTFREIVDKAFAAVKAVASAVVDWFLGSFVPFWTTTLPGAFRSVVDWVRAHWPLILVLLTGPMGLAVVGIVKHWDDITGAFRAAKDWVVGTFAFAWAGVQAMILDPLVAAKDRIVALFGEEGPIRAAFAKAVAGIGIIWAGLKEAARAPVEFVVNTVYNDGIRKVVNAIPGVPDLPELKFATGGQVTGGQAGRDSVRAWLTPGEHVWTAEEVRRMGGHRAMYALRKSVLAGSHERGYAGGGIVNVDGEPLTDVAARQLALAEQLSGMAMRVIQGSYQPATAYSGTSHTGGGVMDTSPGSFAAQSWLRKVGFAAWARNIPGAAYAGSGAHVHSVSMLDPTARGHAQIASYLAGGDGLGGADYGPRPAMLANLSELLGGVSVPGGGGGGGLFGMIRLLKDFVSDIKGWVSELADMGGWGGMMKQMVSGIVGQLREWINDQVPGPGPMPDLFDRGGWLLPGAPVNRTGRPEAVLTPEESAAFVDLARRLSRGGGAGSSQPPVHIGPIYAPTGNGPDIARQVALAVRMAP